jgi:hypothetical protein
MTFPDRRLDGPIEPPESRSENRQDVVPVSERSQDPQRSTHELVTETSRPLTDAERKAADRDSGIAERVYAPASERVPKTVEGYRDVIEHPDNATPERQAIGQPSTSPTMTSDAEPSFTRVPRPGNGGYDGGSTTYGPESSGYGTSSPSYGNTDYGSTDSAWNQQSNRWMSNLSSSSAVPFGIGWLTIGVIGGVGVWLWMRWQRERNKPINRLRRQAMEARKRAYALRDQMPDMPEEAVRPAMGVGTALISLAVLLWQQSQRSRSRQDEVRSRVDSRSRDVRKAGRKAVDAVNDIDWMERLALLRELWNERSPIAR